MGKELEHLTDEQISVKYNNFKKELIAQGYEMTTKEFVWGMRNGCFDYKAYEERQKQWTKNMEEFQQQRRQESSSATVICPYCQSIKTKKITTTGRMFSTGLLGLASSKVGKQWHCTKCNSDF